MRTLTMNNTSVTDAQGQNIWKLMKISKANELKRTKRTKCLAFNSLVNNQSFATVQSIFHI